MRTLKPLSLAAAAAVSVALVLTGCTSSTEGTANPVGAAAETDKTNTADTADTADSADKADKADKAAPVFDLCSALPVKDLEGVYLQSDLPFKLTKHIDFLAYHDAGMAACHYGTYLANGVQFSVPLGDPAPDVAGLIGGASTSGKKELKTFTIGSDKGYLRDEGSLGIQVAVQHGDSQFTLFWKSLDDVENDTVTPDQMIALAKKVAEKLPTKFSLKAQDLPKECDAVKGMDKIVGKVTMAWGTADADELYCTYAGPKGILNSEALKWPAETIERQITTILKVSPEDELKPAIASDVVVMARGINGGVAPVGGFKVEGHLKLCCEFRVELNAGFDQDERGDDVDPDERLFLTSFADAARVWK